MADGDSGSPLVDGAGRLVGIVVADQAGEGIAVDATEVATMLGGTAAADDLELPAPANMC